MSANYSYGGNRVSCNSSYSTFVPQYTVDSEYLKTLLVGKYLPCELSNPICSSSFGSLPTHQRNCSGDSGVLSGNSASFPSLEVSETEPDFFHECEKQIKKLFDFVEFHLLTVERKMKTYARVEEVMDEKEEKKDEKVSEKTPLNGGLDKVVLAKPKEFLMNLKEVLTSLTDSIVTSFQYLDALVELHDDSNSSQKGKDFLAEYQSHKNELEQRISLHLDEINAKLTSDAKDSRLEVSSDGSLQLESTALLKVKQYQPGCSTLLHVLIFIASWLTLSFMYYYHSRQHALWAVVLRLLRSPFLVVFYFYLFGINTKAWANKFVDYIKIFEFPPNGIPTTKYAWKVAGMFCVLFTSILVILLVINYFNETDVPVKAAATLMWLLLLGFLLNPMNLFLRKGRFAFILVVARILIAPFHTVYFGDFWFADQLNSLVGILLDLQYYFCFIFQNPLSMTPNKAVCTSSSNGIRPIVSSLPALWRFLQCLRYFYDERKSKHLINAVKYFTTFPVIVFATVFSVQVSKSFTLRDLWSEENGWIVALWALFSFIHALYTFIWDVYCDWGLLQFSKGTLLRTNRLYSWKSFYYIAIVNDFILRFAWTAKLTLAIVWHIDSDVIYTGLVAAEIFRRFMWNFFRVEYEQTLRS